MSIFRSLRLVTRPRLTYANLASTAALVVALGTGTAYAANTVFSTDIVDGEVKSVDLATNAVNTGKIINGGVWAQDIKAGDLTGAQVADGGLTGADVANESLTLSDIVGANVQGHVAFSSIADGRCQTVSLNVGGAATGDGVAITAQGAMPAGMFLYGTQVSAANTVKAVICNLSGATSPAITDLAVRIVTYR